MNGVPEETISIRNVRLNDISDQHFLHEVRIKGAQEGLPKLVMIHGYMAGGGQFSKMIGYLRPYFEVLTIDLLGMGRSGRPLDVSFDSFDAAISFFLDSIHKWTEVT